MGFLLWLSMTVAWALPPDLAVHEGVLQGSELHWYSRVEHGGEARLELAVPLPADVLAPEGGVERDDDGRIVALGPLTSCCVQEVHLVQPGVSLGEATLFPPMVERASVQRVAVRGVDVDPAEELGLTPHMSGWWASTVTREERRRLRRLAKKVPSSKGDGGHRARRPLFVHSSVVRPSEGLHVTLSQDSPVAEGALWRTGLLFVLVLLLLALLYRGLAQAEEREQARRYVSDTP